MFKLIWKKGLSGGVDIKKKMNEENKLEREVKM
jgi:hypothetical protein